jgi:hypothetical protein
VHVYVGPAGYAFDANLGRSDVGAIFPGYGSGHGYLNAVPDPGGPITVCVYAINTAGSGTNQVLGCRSL